MRQRRTFARRLGVLVVALLILASGSAAGVPSAAALSSTVVISQVYGGGGQSGAPYQNDFVELFNRGTTTVSLDGWSVQYASATGSGTFAMNPVTLLSGSLAPGQYYLVRMASGGGAGAPLPTPDTTGIVNMAAAGAKVVLASTTTGLACNGGSVPCTPEQLALMVDLIGWGTANFFEGAVGPTTSVTTAALRGRGGFTETDDNAADFSVGVPNPRNTASPQNVPPTVTLQLTDGQTLTGSSSVIQGTAADHGGAVASVAVSIQRSGDGFHWNGSAWDSAQAWLAASGTTSWTYDWTFDPASQDGSPPYTIVARATDDVGNTGISTVTGVNVDNVAPGDASVSIAAGAIYTTSRDVALTLAATGATQMRFSNDDSTWSDWEAYDTARSWTLAADDGEKTVSVQFADDAGNWVGASDGIILDATAPSGSVRIAGGAVAVNKLAVALGCEATGATQMRFSNDGSTWSDWEAYATAKSWTLAAGDGEKTVSVQFADEAGNWVGADDGILLDTRKPTPTASKAVSVRRGAKATLRFRISDPAPDAGKATVRIVVRRLDGKKMKTVTLKNQPVGKARKYRFTCWLRKGSYRVAIFATDAAGNRQTKVARTTLTVK